MEMKEVEITYGNLFKLISEEECITYELEKEYFQTTPLKVKNEINEWVDIKGLIKKETEVIELELNNSTTIICAKRHLIQMTNGNMIFAYFLKVGNSLKNINGDDYIITNIKTLNDKQIVFDMEVDNKTHIYQCSLGLIHHNTLLTSAIIKYANILNMKTIIIVPSSSLLKQTHDYINQFEIPIGMFGGGRKDEAKNIVATWQTLQNNKAYIKNFECIIWDECLHPHCLIRMSDNSEKRIDEIAVGDLVKTLNEDNNQIEDKAIINIYKNLKKSENQKMFQLTMVDGSSIKLTGNHEVLTQNGWKRTDCLTIEDDIINF